MGRWRELFIILISFLSAECLAKVIQNDISLGQKELFSYVEVCTFMGIAEAPLIDADIAQLDCMGKKIKAIDFCTKKSSAPNLLRGYVDVQEKKVVCQNGERVILTISCEKSGPQYCQNAEVGCQELKKVFANRLEVVHSALIEGKESPKIQCFYSAAAKSESMDAKIAE